MKKVYLLSFCLGFLLLNCKKKELPKEGLQEIRIPNHKAKLNFAADELFELEFIPLETTIESVIYDEADKIRIINDTIYIVDGKVSQTISLFDIKGKFLKKIYPHAQGPDRFSDIHRTEFHPKENKIEIYDRAENRTVELNLNGDFIKSKHLPFYYNYKARLDKRTTIYDCFGSSNLNWNIDTNDYNSYTLLIVDDSIGPISNLRPYPPAVNLTMFFEPWDLFYSYGYSMSYYRPFCDTVFKIKKRRLTPKYVLKYQKNPHPVSLLNDPFIKERIGYCMENKHPFTSQVFETPRYIFVFYHFRGRINCFAFDKIRNESVMNAGRLYFKEIGVKVLPPKASGGTNKDLVRLLSASDFHAVIDEAAKRGKLPDYLKEMRKNLKDSDNPVLMRYKIRI